jgi:glycosyltransferase involved in cell wall biosynthesis
LLVSLVPELARLGVDVEVAALFDWPEDIGVELERAGFRVHRLNVSHRWSVPEAMAKLNNVLANGRFDAIWGNLYFGNLYVLLSKMLHRDLRAIISMHGPGYAQTPPARMWDHFRVALERELGHRFADARVAVSKAVAEDYTQALGWDPIEVIYNGVPAHAIADRPPPKSRKTVRERFGVDERECLFVVPSRYVPHKGHSVLVDAIAILRDRHHQSAHVLAIGHGPELPKLKSQAERLGVAGSVAFVNPLPQPELFDLLRCSEGVIMPSLREPFGIAAAEAMALGVPVIASAVDGLLEVAGDDADSMLLVPPGDASRLADAMAALCTRPELREKLGNAGRARVLGAFDISVCASRWAQALQDSRSPAHPPRGRRAQETSTHPSR